MKKILTLTLIMVLTLIAGLSLTVGATTDPFDAEGVSFTIYYVTVDSAIENGTVTANAAKASASTTITLTVTPDEGYELDTISVKDANGVDVSDGREYYLLVTPYTVIGDSVKNGKTVKVDVDTDGKASFVAKENHTISVVCD